MRLLGFEAHGGVFVPEMFRNPVGQLRMDAPYTHRDFVRPAGPIATPDKVQEGPRELLVKKRGVFTRYATEFPLMDVVGWDGFVYPFAFAIEKYQPKTGQVHLPPTIHAHLRGPGLPHLLVRAARDRHAPAGHPVPVPALERRLRRDHPLPARQLHEPPRRGPGRNLAAPRGRGARPAPGRLRGEHRRHARPTSSRSCATPTSRSCPTAQAANLEDAGLPRLVADAAGIVTPVAPVAFERARAPGSSA